MNKRKIALYCVVRLDSCNKIRNPIMATAFSYSTSVVHFRYPSQKATANPVLAHFQKPTANPVFVHATIKLLKPLHVTRRIGVRALHNSCRCEIGFNGREWKCEPVRTGGQKEKYTCRDEFLKLLKSNCGTNNLTNLAESLSQMLIHIGKHSEENGGLVTLYKDILEPAHISRMWEIAGYNYTNKAADMLPLEQHSPVKWGGMSGHITQGIVGVKRKRGDEDSQKPLKQFPLEGKWEMELHRCVNREAYNVVFKGKSRWFPVKNEGLVFVEKNLNGIPPGVEPFDLAFDFGADGPWPLSNHFVIYTRAAGPNALIGQAWTGGENSKRLWAEVILVKRK